MANKPEKTIKVGGIQFSIWANDAGKGTFYSLTIDKSYKDEKGNWQKSKNFKASDLVLLKLGIDEALKYLYLKEEVIQPERISKEF